MESLEIVASLLGVPHAYALADIGQTVEDSSVSQIHFRIQSGFRKFSQVVFNWETTGFAMSFLRNNVSLPHLRRNKIWLKSLV